MGLAPPAEALVTEADFDDHGQLHPERAPMLESVGQLGKRRSGSAVYLGKRWIITAYHAFAGRDEDVVHFMGEEYKLLPATAVRLKNPEGVRRGRTDLVMVRLATAPNLPEIVIDEHSPFIDEKVVMVGCGETEMPKPADMRLTQGTNHNGIQTISDGMVDGIASPRWGENEIAERGLSATIKDGSGSTEAFATIWQESHQTRKTQGASGDSGGGVFVKRGERWKLTGIMLSVLHREEMNASATFSADLSVYRDQINATIPEPSVVGLLGFASLLLIGRRSR